MDKVAIVGPGKAFGRELVENARSRGYETTAITRSIDEWSDIADDAIGFTLPEYSDELAHALKGSEIRNIIYNMRSGRTKDLENIRGLLEDIRVGAFSALALYHSLSNINYTPDNFVITGGGFGDFPDLGFPGLSVEKAALHSIARGLIKKTQSVKLVVLEGAFNDISTRQKAASRIISALSSDKQEFIVTGSRLES